MWIALIDIAFFFRLPGLAADKTFFASIDIEVAMRPKGPAAAVPATHTSPWASPPAHWRNLSVLVAEDHATYGALMGWLLQKFGLCHEVVGDGQAAVAASEFWDFDLVISDCRMPVMNGYAMAQRMRLREQTDGRRRVPILALSAELTPDDLQRGLEAGMDGWLLKPLSAQRLREVLEHWLPGTPDASTQPAKEVAQAAWPTRAELIETFGDEQVVNRMLHSLLQEANKDYAGLLAACSTLDRQATVDCLHRLLGSLAFLAGREPVAFSGRLIESVRAHGIVINQEALQQFEQDVIVYLRYLTDL